MWLLDVQILPHNIQCFISNFMSTELVSFPVKKLLYFDISLSKIWGRMGWQT